MSDPMFDDEMAEYVDEEEVRRLLNDLGYKNPSREAIEQTIIETRKVFRQQRALLDDQEGDNIDDIVESNQQNDNYWRRSAGDGTTANNPVDVSGLQTDTSEGDAGGSQHDEWIRSQHQRMPPPQRMPHFLAAEKMDESDLGADFPSHRQYRGNPSPGDEAISAAGRTTSTPAHAVGRTPTSNNQNQRQVRKAPDNRNAVHTDQRPHNQAAITIPSSTSSRPSSVAARRNPYHRRSEDPQHLQHFAPYLNLMQSEAQHSFERKSLGKLPDQNQFSPRTTSNVQSTSKPSPTPRPSTAASMRSNVIYAFTGDRNYRPRVLTPAGAQARPVARHSDPVTRGAQMRQVWKKDDFLSQRGRKEELWEVRRSMLSWEGQ
ncbi:Hypothetical protein, putative [Bodo saltans]|uniref:Centriolar and ciliogenesis-associated protein HYLS1 C-terminal domain-containing protein n=1 Tax=Bodo saltans TaxID=75058 RepID=A0A0S4JU67_BODSA|nr:Hypothetical protein, putative [Bodo saltans]|eukprot:CUG92981.1 Hypothetical protein, putative [Bodo saltans]